MHGTLPHIPRRSRREETKLGIIIAGACLVFSIGFVAMMSDKPRVNVQRVGETPLAVLPSPARLRHRNERLA